MDILDSLLNETKTRIKDILAVTKVEISKIKAGKIDTEIFNNIQVLAYNQTMLLRQIATIKNLDIRTIEIKPWEKSLLKEIEKSIMKSDLGFTPQNNGEVITIIAPPLTEERRLQLVKIVKTQIEDEKIKIRNIRQKAKDEFKNLKKEGISENLLKTMETELQKIIDSSIKDLETILEDKKKDLMTL